jgi:hypothetical protein
MAVTHEIKTVELAKLVPYENNPNVHPIEQVKAIAESIESYGQYYPIIVDEDMRILCGHGKKLALEHLGHKKGEVKILKGLTEKQKLRIVIEDNKIQSMSYVDYTKVEAIIREVGELDIIGFGTEYLDAIINENVKDNMGVDFSLPIEHKSNAKQIEDIPQQKQEDQDEERNSIEDGMQQARTIICPHCGKEIVI